MDQEAAARVMKARVELIRTRRFYGVLVSNVEPVPSRKFPTMATNGHNHFYNPDFIATLTTDELLGVQAHESEHDARHHHSRRRGRDPKRWNEACDYAINLDLIDQGFKLPEGCLIDKQYRGMSAEDIYRTRELALPDASQDAPSDGQQSSGDPGGCGEVIDSGDAGQMSDTDVKWERIVRQAASVARGFDQLPGHVDQEIERANNPTQDWREVLRAWVDEGSRRIETWNKPNRRYMGRGIVLPGSQRDGLNHVAIIVDTSYSIDENALRNVSNEMQGALDDGAIDRLTVIYCHTSVYRVDEYRSGDVISLTSVQRGGTDMRPAFAHVTQLDDVSLIICFTDLAIGDPGPQPTAPVLWAVYGYPQAVGAAIANAPWGEPAIDVGAL